MELAIEMRQSKKIKKLRRATDPEEIRLLAMSKNMGIDPDLIDVGVKMENPFFHIDEPLEPKQIKVIRMLRDDPLAKLHSRGYIGEGELQAGRKLQELFEASEIGSISSQDPSREYVDGGGQIRDIFTVKQERALKLLAEVRNGLGQSGYDICRSFLAERKTIEQIALAHHHVVTKAAITYMGHRFRECLKTASVILGYAMEKR